MLSHPLTTPLQNLKRNEFNHLQEKNLSLNHTCGCDLGGLSFRIIHAIGKEERITKRSKNEVREMKKSQ